MPARVSEKREQINTWVRAGLYMYRWYFLRPSRECVLGGLRGTGPMMPGDVGCQPIHSGRDLVNILGIYLRHQKVHAVGVRIILQRRVGLCTKSSPLAIFVWPVISG